MKKTIGFTVLAAMIISCFASIASATPVPASFTGPNDFRCTPLNASGVRVASHEVVVTRPASGHAIARFKFAVDRYGSYANGIEFRIFEWWDGISPGIRLVNNWSIGHSSSAATPPASRNWWHDRNIFGLPNAWKSSAGNPPPPFVLWVDFQVDHNAEIGLQPIIYEAVSEWNGINDFNRKRPTQAYILVRERHTGSTTHPDLVIDNIRLDTARVRNNVDAFKIYITVRNASNCNAGASSVRFHIGNTASATIPVPALAAGASTTVSGSYSISSFFAFSGRYDLYAVADSGNVINEGFFEGNNKFWWCKFEITANDYIGKVLNWANNLREVVKMYNRRNVTSDLQFDFLQGPNNLLNFEGMRVEEWQSGGTSTNPIHTSVDVLGGNLISNNNFNARARMVASYNAAANFTASLSGVDFAASAGGKAQVDGQLELVGRSYILNNFIIGTLPDGTVITLTNCGAYLNYRFSATAKAGAAAEFTTTGGVRINDQIFTGGSASVNIRGYGYVGAMVGAGGKIEGGLTVANRDFPIMSGTFSFSAGVGFGAWFECSFYADTTGDYNYYVDSGGGFVWLAGKSAGYNLQKTNALRALWYAGKLAGKQAYNYWASRNIEYARLFGDALNKFPLLSWLDIFDDNSMLNQYIDRELARRGITAGAFWSDVSIMRGWEGVRTGSWGSSLTAAQWNDIGAEMGVNINDAMFPFSRNPYDNNFDYAWTITRRLTSTQTGMTVSFSNRNTEANRDFIRIYDRNNMLLAEWSGNHGPGSINIGHYTTPNGTRYATCKIRLQTDASVTASGFTVSSVTPY